MEEVRAAFTIRTGKVPSMHQPLGPAIVKDRLWMALGSFWFFLFFLKQNGNGLSDKLLTQAFFGRK